jgi:hypothetical protein
MNTDVNNIENLRDKSKAHDSAFMMYNKVKCRDKNREDDMLTKKRRSCAGITN